MIEMVSSFEFTGDNGPQMKKPTIEGGASAQAIAQAAIAK